MKPEQWVDVLFLNAASYYKGKVRRPHSLLAALRLGLIPPLYMERALAILRDLETKPVIPKKGIPARSAYNDPGWDNVIRAYEEDR